MDGYAFIISLTSIVKCINYNNETVINSTNKFENSHYLFILYMHCFNVGILYLSDREKKCFLTDKLF